MPKNYLALCAIASTLITGCDEEGVVGLDLNELAEEEVIDQEVIDEVIDEEVIDQEEVVYEEKVAIEAELLEYVGDVDEDIDPQYDLAVPTPTPQAISQSGGWTGFTWSGKGPVNCLNAQVTKFDCRGGGCEDVDLYCQPTSAEITAQWWTNYHSNEYNGHMNCGPYTWITGVSCIGTDCDSLSYQCSKTPSDARKDCWFTGTYSENALVSFPVGYKLAGVKCHGSFCKEKSFWLCK